MIEIYNIKKYIILILFNFFTSEYFAQDTASYSVPKRIVFSTGIAYQKQWIEEFTMMYANYEMGPCGYAVSGLRLGSEFIFSNPKIIIAPKIGYQFAGMLFCARVSEINYLHNNTVDIRLLPEIGIDFVTGANLCYGYNIHLLGDRYADISDHRVTLIFNIYVDPKKKKK